MGEKEAHKKAITEKVFWGFSWDSLRKRILALGWDGMYLMCSLDNVFMYLSHSGPLQMYKHYLPNK
jgi:hypothetical protein